VVEAAPALLHLAQFAPLVGTAFQLQPADGPAQTATLIEASDAGLPAFQGRVPFSLLFECPGSDVLPQGIQLLQHPALGALELFLVPVGRNPAGVRYQAVFN
jgi:hypothetical protein